MKEIRRKVDNGIIYQKLYNDIKEDSIINARMLQNLKVDLGIEKRQNALLTRSNELYKANENIYVEKFKIYDKEIRKQKRQKIIIIGSAIILETLTILAR